MPPPPQVWGRVQRAAVDQRATAVADGPAVGARRRAGDQAAAAVARHRHAAAGAAAHRRRRRCRRRHRCRRRCPHRHAAARAAAAAVVGAWRHLAAVTASEQHTEHEHGTSEWKSAFALTPSGKEAGESLARRQGRFPLPVWLHSATRPLGACLPGATSTTVPDAHAFSSDAIAAALRSAMVALAGLHLLQRHLHGRGELRVHQRRGLRRRRLRLRPEPPRRSVCCKPTGAEVCDKVDNDCDGFVDNTGKQETCNGEDDDCNGRVDDGFDLKTNSNHCGACNHACARQRVLPRRRVHHPAREQLLRRLRRRQERQDRLRRSVLRHAPLRRQLRLLAPAEGRRRLRRRRGQRDGQADRLCRPRLRRQVVPRRLHVRGRRRPDRDRLHRRRRQRSRHAAPTASTPTAWATSARRPTSTSSARPAQLCRCNGGVQIAEVGSVLCRDGVDNDCDGKIDCAEEASCIGQSCSPDGGAALRVRHRRQEGSDLRQPASTTTATRWSTAPTPTAPMGTTCEKPDGGGAAPAAAPRPASSRQPVSPGWLTSRPGSQASAQFLAAFTGAPCTTTPTPAFSALPSAEVPLRHDWTLPEVEGAVRAAAAGAGLPRPARAPGGVEGEQGAAVQPAVDQDRRLPGRLRLLPAGGALPDRGEGREADAGARGAATRRRRRARRARRASAWARPGAR